MRPRTSWAPAAPAAINAIAKTVEPRRDMRRRTLESHEEGCDGLGPVRMRHVDDEVSGDGHVLLQGGARGGDHPPLRARSFRPARLVAADQHQPGERTD